jgi:hypothetical protein
MEHIEVFIQGESIPHGEHFRVGQEVRVREVLALLVTKHSSFLIEELIVMEEDGETLLEIDALLPVTDGRSSRLHVHRCAHVPVRVNFSNRHIEHEFRPGTTIGKVKRWAIDEFKIASADATEYVLQIAGTLVRPDADTHVGSLVSCPACSVAFDLVMNVRVNG